MSAEEDSKLCLACGLCCAGVVFSGVRLLPREVKWAHKHRLDVLAHPGGHAFRQPCALLQDDNACEAYRGRPQHCQDFRCKTLNALRDGAVSFDAALEALMEISDLKAAIEERLPEEQDEGFFWNFMALHADPGLSEADRENIANMFPTVIEDAKTLRALVEERIHKAKPA